MGWPEALKQIDEEFKEEGGLLALIKQRLNSDKIIDAMIEQCGEEEILQHLLAKLTHAQRQELKRRLEETPPGPR